MPNKRKNIRRQWVKVRNPFDRDRKRHWFYNTNKWRKLSKLFKEQNPLCIECKRNGLAKKSEVSDHIKGLKYCLDNNIDPYSFSQLQPLCKKCHNSKSGREKK